MKPTLVVLALCRSNGVHTVVVICSAYVREAHTWKLACQEFLFHLSFLGFRHTDAPTPAPQPAVRKTVQQREQKVSGLRVALPYARRTHDA